MSKVYLWKVTRYEPDHPDDEHPDHDSSKISWGDRDSSWRDSSWREQRGRGGGSCSSAGGSDRGYDGHGDHSCRSDGDGDGDGNFPAYR